MIIQNKPMDFMAAGNMEDTDFSIDGDSLHIIFDILRSKLYKNPIGSICREIASNSRDAQREIGDYKTPIEIEIIDNRNSLFIEDGMNIIFRDRGIGLSPDRIKSIYSKYGASTKRDTNNLTGGFGLGAKTPFALVDTFIVKTIVDGIKYEYCIYIDPSQKGKISKLVEEQVEHEGNMTEICIPIATDENREKFEEEVLINTFFWDVRPKLIGFNKSDALQVVPAVLNNMDKKTVLCRENDYVVIEKPRFISTNLNAIIDGIYYPIDDKLINYNFHNFNYAICLYFNNGDLTISANRENLQYDDDTINTIRKRAEDIFKSILSDYQATIDNIKSYKDARFWYLSIKNDNMFLFCTNKNKAKLVFNDIPLEIQPPVTHLEFYYFRPGSYSKDSEFVLNREEMTTIWASNVKNAFDHIYYIPALQLDIDNNKDFDKLNRPAITRYMKRDINRTLYNQNNKKGFLVIVNAYYKYSPDKIEDQLAGGKKSLELLKELGFDIKDYFAVAKTKAPVKKKDNNQLINLRRYSNGTGYRTEYKFNENKGYFIQPSHYGKILVSENDKRAEIVYYQTHEERGLNALEKILAIDLSKLLYKLSPRLTLIMAGPTKIKYLKKHLSFDDFFKFNKKKLVPIVVGSNLVELIDKAKNYHSYNYPFNDKIKASLSELRDLGKNTKVIQSRIGIECKNFLKERYNINFDATIASYREIFIEIDKLYPGLKRHSFGSVNVSEYVAQINQINNLKNENEQLKKIIEEYKLKYNVV